MIVEMDFISSSLEAREKLGARAGCGNFGRIRLPTSRDTGKVSQRRFARTPAPPITKKAQYEFTVNFL
jgi:hypothetical protein